MHTLQSIIRHSVKHARRFSNVSSLRQSTAAAVTASVPKEGSQWESTNPIQLPQPDGPNKTLSPKLEQLVASISSLSLLEVSELSQALKTRLNLPDAPMIPMGAMAFGGQPAPVEEEDDTPKVVKSSFTVKLMKFDEKQKVALIKEIKNTLEGMNLVQAKKFVESAPAVVKADIGKDEAEKLKEALSKVGGECAIE